MKSQADFHPFMIDGSWYEAYWLSPVPAKARVSVFLAITATVRRLRGLGGRQYLSNAKPHRAAIDNIG